MMIAAKRPPGEDSSGTRYTGWMAPTLGAPLPHYQHVVPIQAEQQHKDGLIVAFESRCGEWVMPASTKYLRRYRPCPTCVMKARTYDDPAPAGGFPRH
jgi:hypothetical protein